MEIVMNLDEAKTELAKELAVIYPGHHVAFSVDPDDNGIVYVRVYGVQDDEVNNSKKRVWDEIDSLGLVDNVEFIPSIVSLTNTSHYHPELLPAVDDFDSAIPDDIMLLLENTPSSSDVRPMRVTPCIVGWGDEDDLELLHNIEEVTDERSFKVAA